MILEISGQTSTKLRSLDTVSYLIGSPESKEAVNWTAEMQLFMTLSIFRKYSKSVQVLLGPLHSDFNLPTNWSEKAVPDTIVQKA